MAIAEKKTKADPAPKKETPSKDKKEAPSKDKSAPAADAPKAADTSKPEGGEMSGDTSKSYSRGEGQKPVTQAYKDNWNAIFAKKKRR